MLAATAAHANPRLTNEGFRRFRRQHMERAQKEQVLGEIKEAWQNVASIVVADYRGHHGPGRHRDAR